MKKTNFFLKTMVYVVWYNILYWVFISSTRYNILFAGSNFILCQIQVNFYNRKNDWMFLNSGKLFDRINCFVMTVQTVLNEVLKFLLKTMYCILWYNILYWALISSTWYNIFCQIKILSLRGISYNPTSIFIF